jgi:Mg/Co/Ni transporter MgtE
MYEGRDLKEEVKELGITTMEDVSRGSRESAFAALDVIREHNKLYPEEKLAEMMEAARREAYENMAGRKGEN